MSESVLPLPFVVRRLHSLTGLFLALFLIQHLFLNSQAALFFGQDGKTFIEGVNSIHSLPYLPFIEITLLALPILIHMWWGIKILRTGRLNSFPSDGSSPSLNYPRNRAYSWQRITSWILVVGLIGHVVHMRFLNYPEEVKGGYAIELSQDVGLSKVAGRLGVDLKQDGDGLIAIAPDFGTAELFVVRETFKHPILIVLYTLFVLSAAFHGMNGLWTFLISWGITLNEKSQKIFAVITNYLMVFVALMGLVAIYGTYWINLYE